MHFYYQNMVCAWVRARVRPYEVGILSPYEIGLSILTIYLCPGISLWLATPLYITPRVYNDIKREECPTCNIPHTNALH